MTSAIILFLIVLLTSHIWISKINDIKKLNRIGNVIEYIWLFGAFSGIVFGFGELNRNEKNQTIQREYNENWVNYNQARMQLLYTIPFYSNRDEKGQNNEEYRWMNALWQELEKGYENILWKTIVFANYDKIVHRGEYGSVRLEHQTVKESIFSLDTSKVSTNFIEEIKPIILKLEDVSSKWKSPKIMQAELDKKAKLEAFLKNIMPFFLSIVLGLRISRIYLNERMKEIKAV
jgi:hypothetical protein